MPASHTYLGVYDSRAKKRNRHYVHNVESSEALKYQGILTALIDLPADTCFSCARGCHCGIRYLLKCPSTYSDTYLVGT